MEEKKIEEGVPARVPEARRDRSCEPPWLLSPAARRAATDQGPAARCAREAQQPPRLAAPTTAPAAKPPQTIEFLAWGDTTDGPAWDKLSLAVHGTLRLGATVNITQRGRPERNNFYTKLQTMYAGGTPPTLASFQGWEWQMYADKGLLAPGRRVDRPRQRVTAAYPKGIQQRRAEHEAWRQDAT
jgi:hypothetical protein